MTTRLSDLPADIQSFIWMGRNESGLDYRPYIQGIVEGHHYLRSATTEAEEQHLLDIGYQRVLWPWECSTPNNWDDDPDLHWCPVCRCPRANCTNERHELEYLTPEELTAAIARYVRYHKCPHNENPLLCNTCNGVYDEGNPHEETSP